MSNETHLTTQTPIEDQPITFDEAMAFLESEVERAHDLAVVALRPGIDLCSENREAYDANRAAAMVSAAFSRMADIEGLFRALSKDQIARISAARRRFNDVLATVREAAEQDKMKRPRHANGITFRY